MLASRSTLPQSTEGFQVSMDEIGWFALGPTIATTVLASTVVGLRWYTRAFIARCIGNDDMVILVSLILAWIICVLVGLQHNEGLGSYNSSEVDASHLAKLIIATNDVWALATNVTKASILAQYLRIFSNPMLRYACSFIITLLLLSACWGIFAGTFLCRPMEKLWQPELPGHCMDALAYWISAAVVNSALDLVVLILPLPLIMTLHLPLRQKVFISTLFLLGFLVFLISVIRFTTVYVEAARGDQIRSGMYAVLWSAIEVNIGIICASLLALKPLIAKWFPFLLDESRQSGQWPRTWYRQRNAVSREPEITIIVAPPTPVGSCSTTLTSTMSKSDSDHYERLGLEKSGVKIRDFAL